MSEAAPPGAPDSGPNAQLEPGEVAPRPWTILERGVVAGVVAPGPNPQGYELDTEVVYVQLPGAMNRTRTCRKKGCMRKSGSVAHNHFCVLHSGIKKKPSPVHTCRVQGCTKMAIRVGRRCQEHAEEVFTEEVARICRDRKLRERWLFTIYNQQDLRCAAPMLTCHTVDFGRPTVLCPWNGRVVPIDMLDLDHKKPISEGGSDDRTNLQLLCCCCHAFKSRAEQRRASKARVA